MNRAMKSNVLDIICGGHDTNIGMKQLITVSALIGCWSAAGSSNYGVDVIQACSIGVWTGDRCAEDDRMLRNFIDGNDEIRLIQTNGNTTKTSSVNGETLCNRCRVVPITNDVFVDNWEKKNFIINRNDFNLYQSIE